jgi:predicted metallo-beta-lactamase superfamily hydrolase
LASESFGVRSMCTYVETSDVKILLDAGVSLAPSRFGLPPHPLEYEAIARLRKNIAEAADKAEVVTISHYHFDHHTPSFEDWLVNWTEAKETARQIYQDKRVLLKNPREKINPSQRYRAWLFEKTGGKRARSLESADGKSFTFGADTVLSFFEPVAHGPEGGALGWVIMAQVTCDDEVFVFAPDVQGPMSSRALELIRAARPEVAVVGGPPFYLGGFKVDELELQQGVRNLTTLAKTVPVLVLEHHALRDEAWSHRVKPVFEAASRVGNVVKTAAEFAGLENVFLEFRRKRLFEEFPPSMEFEKWMNEPAETRSLKKPPI